MRLKRRAGAQSLDNQIKIVQPDYTHELQQIAQALLRKGTLPNWCKPGARFIQTVGFSFSQSPWIRLLILPPSLTVHDEPKQCVSGSDNKVLLVI